MLDFIENKKSLTGQLTGCLYVVYTFTRLVLSLLFTYIVFHNIFFCSIFKLNKTILKTLQTFCSWF